jgi:hypothetical protein
MDCDEVSVIKGVAALLFWSPWAIIKVFDVAAGATLKYEPTESDSLSVGEPVTFPDVNVTMASAP